MRSVVQAPRLRLRPPLLAALTPLEKVGVRDWHAAEDAPETFPSGL